MVQDNPNKVIIVLRKSENNVKISSDSQECLISGILVLTDRQVLVVDQSNNIVKLLDQQNQVVSHCSMTKWPVDICQITSREVAVTRNDSNIHEVQFITVNNRQIVTGRKLQLLHTCYGIAFHQGDLYITSWTALYKYKLNGKLVSKMYEDTSGDYTVMRCAVSPTGDKLYITNLLQHKLLTLARDGSVLATFTDPALQYPRGVHVTPAGQLLVCGGKYSDPFILQVDSEGKRKLATLGTEKNCMPQSVCYNRHTASIIVGLHEKNNTMVFKVQ
ncbi:uncharacterized protein LOC127847305 [Dreissena polymorpha]|uniref:Uncharacterized protein n=1 Tax=Dreissena polymorpha TaxID=45954 RepID=A0A9D4DGX5_DREPO|nr:uncharacterized protein LOC127847305 [Dreissena polymorpha]KAH3749114.1 hypothetical protein DPMN_183605 [Dreissena polymorpha]